MPALGRLVVVSPHLDDAVFGCGDLLAAHPGAAVVTVFAGGPAADGEPTRWDAAAGFEPGDDVIGIRRAEDRAALALLGARPWWLPFWDSQYGRSPGVADLCAPLEVAVLAAGPTAVLVPLGLWHSDHRLTHEAALALLGRHPGLDWLAYEDAIYRRFPDAALDTRLAALATARVRATPVAWPAAPASGRKRQAVACYRSQIRALSGPGYPGYADAFEPERYWRLTRE